MAVQNAENGCFGVVSGTQGHRQFQRSIERKAYTTSYSTLIETMYRFRDIDGYLSKVADFDPPHLHLAPP